MNTKEVVVALAASFSKEELDNMILQIQETNKESQDFKVFKQADYFLKSKKLKELLKCIVEKIEVEPELDISQLQKIEIRFTLNQ